jgi:hypothetical protein
MGKTDDDIIDEVLKFFKNDQPSINIFKVVVGMQKEKPKTGQRITLKMKELGYTNLLLDGSSTLTSLGYKVRDSGGHLKKLEEIENEKRKNLKRQELQDQLLKNNFILSKWQVYAFWIVFSLTVIGSVLGVIAFIRSIKL